MMKDFFKAELLRFRTWALAAGLVHVVVLGFMTRLVDLAQQPKVVYQVFGMVYVVAGALLGLYQMGTYRRPNNWLNLLHRPLHRHRIALALCGAGALTLALAVALPILVVAGYQETATARVVDVRHWLLPLAGLQLALCGYLAGAYAMLADRRYSAAVVVLPVLFMFSQAHGVRALAVQALVLVVLALLVAVAFKPDLSAPPRKPREAVLTALPVMVGAYFLMWMVGIGYELAWTMSGSHPLNSANPPEGGYIQVDRAEPRERLLGGLAASRHPDAALWREQVALSDVATLYPMRDLPLRGQLTNPMQPPEFDDGERRIRWVFSHDRMRFVGYGVADGRASGELGAGPHNGAFPGPALPFGNDTVFTPVASFQYDSEALRVHPRVQLEDGEVFASPPQPAGDNVAVLSNRALYFYPGREAGSTLDLLKPLLRVPVPGAVGHLAGVDLIELLDGYLVSFTFTNGAWAGEMSPYQRVLQVDGQGNVVQVGERALGFDLPRAYTMRTWWLSPVIRELLLGAQRLFAVPNPLADGEIPAPPRHIVLLALVSCLLSLLGALVLTARQQHTPLARGAWVLASGVVGLPALACLWLMYPRCERAEAAAAPQAALA